jgi:pimeloyl-ACP methyl ester carboxylesterase
MMSLELAQDLDVSLPSGRMRVRRWGRAGSRLVVCVPGLTGNLVSFDYLGSELAGAGFQAVAIDMRGRGFSEVTPTGTYGWPAHAADLVALAETLGEPRFAVVGWSMGAVVGLQAALLAPDRLRRLVLLDSVGRAGPGVVDLFRTNIDRLRSVHPSRAMYIAAVRAIGLIRPWCDLWERYLTYELEQVDGGFRARSSYTAVMEDWEWGGSNDASELWPDLTSPVLLVRALEPLRARDVEVVPEASRDAFLGSVPHAHLVEVDANHYSVVTSPATVAATAEFLGRF